MLKSRTRYVPILKTKNGERWAIANLSAQTRRRICPLFEIHDHKTHDIGDHANNICEELAVVWGTSQPFYFDTHWLHGEAGDAEILETVYEAVANSELRAIPVVRPGMNESSLERLSAVVADSGLGVLLRIRRQDLDHPECITGMLASLGASRSLSDLMVDYRSSAMNSLPHDLRRVPYLTEWRALIAASGTFPRSLSDEVKNEWFHVDRSDYASWRDAVAKGLPRYAVFADYTMKDSGAPAEFGAPSVSLKYAREEYWLTWMGGLVKHGASDDMHDVCRSLISRTEEYCGADYSAGDQAINDTAEEESGPGNATQWLQWCINHHIEFTVRQIADVS